MQKGPQIQRMESRCHKGRRPKPATISRETAAQDAQERGESSRQKGCAEEKWLRRDEQQQ